MSEDPITTGNVTGTATEIARIESTIRDDGGAYWRDPALRDRYGALLEVQDSQQGRRSGSASPVRHQNVEIARIEKLMRDDFAAYRADPELQARYGALLEAGVDDTGPGDREISSAPPDTDARNTVTDALGDPDVAFNAFAAAGKEDTLDALSAGGVGNFDGNLRAVQLVAVDVARDLGDAELASGFLEAFDGLPDRVQAQAVTALLNDAGSHSRASAADLATFRAEDDAAEPLLAEWGGDAAARLGEIRARLAAISAGLNAGDRERLDHFVTSAPVEEWTAILRQLADPLPAHRRPGFRHLSTLAA